GFQSLRSGLGSFAIRLPGGTVVAALVAANSLGTIGSPAGGLWLDPLLRAYGFGTPAVTGLPAASTEADDRNTPIAVVDSGAGIARAVQPSHTLFDGDTVFGIATGARPLSEGFESSTRELVSITAAAADALSLAILDAHASAAPADAAWRQPPTLSEIAPDFTSAFTAL